MHFASDHSASIIQEIPTYKGGKSIVVGENLGADAILLLDFYPRRDSTLCLSNKGEVLSRRQSSSVQPNSK